MSKEAMKLALEALEYIRNIDTEVSSQIKYGNAAQSIEEALADQPAQQEPVAWMHIQGKHKELSHCLLDDGEISRGWEQYPLYTSPPAQTSTYTCGVCGVSMQMEQPAPVEEPRKQEIATWMKPHKQCDDACMYLCTKAFTQFPECATAQREPVAKHYVDGGHLIYPKAQRPWVGLTHEDIAIILNNDYGGSRADCIRSAEARLKERNT